MNRTNRPWPRRQAPRTGAVSAFGVSGTNAHVVVESYEPDGQEDQDDPDRAPCYLLALSARTHEALQEKTDDLIDLLQRQDAPLNLARISYTLLEGRHHFAHRRAVVIQDAADAVYALQQAGAGDKRPNLFQGVVPRDFTGPKATERYAEELVTRLGDAEGDVLKRDGDGFREILHALADLYCQGYDIPWRRMFHATGRVHLPTYPFSRVEYWVPEAEERVPLPPAPFPWPNFIRCCTRTPPTSPGNASPPNSPATNSSWPTTTSTAVAPCPASHTLKWRARRWSAPWDSRATPRPAPSGLRMWRGCDLQPG